MFYQKAAIVPENTFASDEVLKKYLNHSLSAEHKIEILAKLELFGKKCGGEFLAWSLSAESNPPRLVNYSPWGHRIDHIEMDQGWKHLEAAAAVNGIVAEAYEKKYGADSRILQMSLLYLYSPSSAFVSCPLAMTDGAARVLQSQSRQNETLKQAFLNLTSRDPAQFWTSGQWMTERIGGSDVSMTETIAQKSDANAKVYKLSGDKWFTSSTTSQMALTLARIDNELSLFFVPMRLADGSLNHLTVNRLKDKLGTKALPTAELSLRGTEAILIGEQGLGVKNIAPLLNITRIYNSICALGHMRRALDLAQDYSQKRIAFGKIISQHDLHKATLNELENEFKKCFELTFMAVELLGKEEAGLASAEEAKLLRALTPLVKMYTGKKVLSICSEVIECFGGAGYIEDTGIPRLLRDAQVFSIWEGTTNVLALDFLRAASKDGAVELLAAWMESKKKSEIAKRIKQLPFTEVARIRKNCFQLCEYLIQSRLPS